MSKPEDIPQDVWDYSAAVEHVYCGCAPGRPRSNGTSHHDSCRKKVEAHARAILAAKAEERESCALIVDAERERILSKQNGKDEQVDHNLRMIAVLFPDVAAAIRKRGEG